MTSVPRFSDIWQGYPTPTVVVHLKTSIHHTMAKNIEEILMVREFPDIFPDDLP
jgi:hypothetical protein